MCVSMCLQKELYCEAYAEVPAKGDGHAASCDRRYTVLRHISTISLQHQAGTCSKHTSAPNRQGALTDAGWSQKAKAVQTHRPCRKLVQFHANTLDPTVHL